MENKATNSVMGYVQPADRIRRAMGRFIDKYFKYIMITPITVILTGVAMYPFFYALWISLTNAKTSNFRSPKFIGLLNYWNIIISLRYWQAAGVTVLYVGGVLLLEIGLALLLAVLVDKATKGQKWYVTLLITPMLISTVFTGIIFRLQLN